MTKITQRGTAGYIHKLFHLLANKYQVNVDKVAEIVGEWEERKDEHNYIVGQLKRKFNVS